MVQFYDITGRKYGKLTVLRRVKSTTWECRCDCGTVKHVLKCNLVTGNTTSCGCVYKASIGNRTRTHGASHSTEYYRYHHMVNRCYNTNYKQYADYGGRGITVCPQWLGRGGFEQFLMDMGPCPKNLSLDRIDNAGNYTPDNCRWASRKMQMRNKRSNTVFKGKCIAEWAEELGVAYSTIRARLRRTGTVYPSKHHNALKK